MRLHAQFLAILGMLLTGVQSRVASSAAEPDWPAPQTNGQRSFRFDPDELAVLIPVNMATHGFQRIMSYPFVVDTGAPVSSFDVSLRGYLQPPPEPLDVGPPKVHDDYTKLHAPQSISFVVPKTRVDENELYTRQSIQFVVSKDRLDESELLATEARIGSLTLTRGRVLCHDFTRLREGLGCVFHGLVGLDFLRDKIVSFDFDEGRMDVLPPGPPRDDKWGESIPLEYDDGKVLIQATLGKDARASFIVDTGHSDTGSIEESLLTRLADSQEARFTGETRAVTYYGTESSRVARLAHFAVASFRHENLRFECGKQNLLGFAYLSRYRVTIDFPNGRLYLAKGKNFARPDRGSSWGLELLFKARGIEVDSVVKKSPASAAGVRAKDVIVEVCGKSISQWTTSEIKRFLKTEYKTTRLTVEREGKRLEMSITPREYD